MVLTISPSFNNYSPDKLAEIAAKVSLEEEEEVAGEAESRSSDKEMEESPPEKSSHDEDQEQQHQEEEEDDFEFPFVCVDPHASPISADEIFFNGHIQPNFPVFNRDLLFADDPNVSSLRLPLRKFLSTERDPPSSSSSLSSSSWSSSSSSQSDELEGVPTGTYCVWNQKSAAASPDRCKKSNSTGTSSKKCSRLRELINRSISDGKDTFVVLAPSTTTATTTKKKKEEKTEPSKERRNCMQVKLDGNMKPKLPPAINGEKVSAHEIHYVTNRAVKEGNKRRSFLPYRQELVGLFANVNGLNRTRTLYPF